MRATIHIVSARDYPLFVAAVRRARRDWWLGAARQRDHVREIEAAAERVRALLADGPRRRDEIVRELGLDTTTWNGVHLWVDLVRVPPSGTWDRRRADLFGLADEWLGPSPDVSEDEGVDHLVRRYLGGFGPASKKDVASFTGLPTTTLAASFDRLNLRRYLDEDGRELLDVAGAPLPEAETPAPPRFLGPWEAALLVHARRTQILPERHRQLVFNTKTPQSIATFLVDGRVAGSWRHENGRVRLEPFERLSRETRLELQDEASRVSEFMS